MDKVKLMGGETMNSREFIEPAGPAAEGAIASTRAPLEARPCRRSRRIQGALRPITDSTPYF
jgi:hypothetical protein